MLSVRGFLTIRGDTDTAYNQPLCSNDFFCSLPSKLGIWKIYIMWFLPHLFCRLDLFTSQKSCACVGEIFSVINESHDYRWRDGEVIV